LASSDRPIDVIADDRGAGRPDRRLAVARRARSSLGAWRSDGAARWLFIWPSVLVILFLSIFPLVASLTLSVTNLVFQKGRIDLTFVGLSNYTSLLFGTERSHFLGALRGPSPLGWAIVAVAALLLGRLFISTVRGRRLSPFGVGLRLVASVLAVGFVYLFVQTLFSDGGRPGALFVTIMFVVVGIALQYVIGLGLAYLAVQPLAGRRFFRIAFLLPLTITPVGVGYMFKMMTDTSKGPLEPVFLALGLRNFTWVTDPWLARLAVVIGDTWQWTPFVFIVLLAALEAQDHEILEAAWVDGAGRLQSFLRITLPQILPVSATVVLIRLIEGFKIIDMPNILLGGGPGTATQSLTLEAYLDWRTLNLGRSAAIAYLLLIIVTVAATAYVALVRRRVTTEPA